MPVITPHPPHLEQTTLGCNSHTDTARECFEILLVTKASVLLILPFFAGLQPSRRPSTYPLELLLQDAGDVEAEVGAEGEEAVEEQHHEPVGACGAERTHLTSPRPPQLTPHPRHASLPPSHPTRLIPHLTSRPSPPSSPHPSSPLTPLPHPPHLPSHFTPHPSFCPSPPPTPPPHPTPHPPTSPLTILLTPLTPLLPTPPPSPSPHSPTSPPPLNSPHSPPLPSPPGPALPQGPTEAGGSGGLGLAGGGGPGPRTPGPFSPHPAPRPAGAHPAPPPPPCLNPHRPRPRLGPGPIRSGERGRAPPRPPQPGQAAERAGGRGCCSGPSPSWGAPKGV